MLLSISCLKLQQDIKSFQDELTMYIADKYADTLGKFKAEDLDVKEKSEVEKIREQIQNIE